MAGPGRSDEGSGDIADWMERRWREVENLGHDAEQAGRDAWAAATRAGQNLMAPRPQDVRALGARVKAAKAAPAITPPTPIRRGGEAILSDPQIAAVVFNETRALSGAGVDTARANIAHALINADETWGAKRGRFARSAPTVATVPEVEQPAYQAAAAAVAAARAQRASGVDPTNGALHFNFRDGPSLAPKKGGLRLHTHAGPFNNSGSGGMPATGVYANTYDD